MFDISAMF